MPGDVSLPKALVILLLVLYAFAALVLLTRLLVPS